jgi:hypothetical protein
MYAASLTGPRRARPTGPTCRATDAAGKVQPLERPLSIANLTDRQDAMRASALSGFEARWTTRGRP